MRKLLSAILLVMFGLLTVTPVFALSMGSELKLPACCRRGGAHQCAGSMEHAGASAMDSGAVRVRAAAATCPYWPLAASATHSLSVLLDPALFVFAAAVSRLAASSQAESHRRLVRRGSRHTRGPPSLLLA